ncbi:peptidyl-prolyl cis-trans isomerase G-like [Octopus sinensis]|uniref:Peptidyl-prolyl cis-trans isomerase G-like n=1 Tax=Octopus sinensis TaxID=2607531 RepID=A0A6P7U8C4_9MOLL|nr:peptidyl-prolyl cis-trans isomerase G-like [Octopus sinensis]
MIQGGDIITGNGTNGESIYGKKFDGQSKKPEFIRREFFSKTRPSFPAFHGQQGPQHKRLTIFHNDSPLPSFGRVLKYFCVFVRKHVVFGQVISGDSVIRRIESLETDKHNRPLTSVTIEGCGEMVWQTNVRKKARKAEKEAKIKRKEERNARREAKLKRKEERRLFKEKMARAAEKGMGGNVNAEEYGSIVIDPDEIPQTPVNFLKRNRNGPVVVKKYNYGENRVDRSGRVIKGRGAEVVWRGYFRGTDRLGEEGVRPLLRIGRRRIV